MSVKTTDLHCLDRDEMQWKTVISSWPMENLGRGRKTVVERRKLMSKSGSFKVRT